MLTIRSEQYAAFSQAANKRFENQVVLHLNKHFPKQCKALGEPQLRETIQYGIQRAAAYGITGKSDVCKYINVMVLFGRDFDTNRRFPWAGEILSIDTNPSMKTSALHRAAKKHLGEI